MPKIEKVSLLDEESGPSVQEEESVEFDIHGGGGSETSYSETFLNFLKGNIGAGFLSLPFAFANGGFLGGTICICIIAVIAVHCMHKIVTVKEFMCRKLNVSYLSYSDVAYNCFGNIGTYVVSFSLLVTQFGFCCVYILFIADHLNELAPNFSPTIYALMILPGAILLSWIRDLKTIAPTSIAANICILYSCIVIFAFLIPHLGKDVKADPTCNGHVARRSMTNTHTSMVFEQFHWSSFAAPPPSPPPPTCAKATKPVAWEKIGKLPIFFGNSIYAFEAIGLVLPMQNGMANRERFHSIISIGMSIVVVLYVAFGLLGYLVFGDSVEGSITLNLPDNTLFNSVKIALCIALFQSIAIQFYPAIAIIERWVFKSKPESSAKRTTYQFALRAVIMTAAAGLAIGIPKLGLVISLIGSLGSGTLALILPPLMHSFAMWKNLTTLQRATDIVIVVFGFVGSCFGIFVSIKDIIG